MRRIALAALLGLAAAPAMAQVSAPPSGQPSAQSTQSTLAPRSPSPATAGLTAPSARHTDQAVDGIGRKLLSEERDRPTVPGQAPSPSQGGSSNGASPTTGVPPHP